MSSARNETVSSNPNWKKAGRKTKRGKPTGRREVVEKYKAIGMDTLDCGNRKQRAIRDRVFGYGFSERSFVAPTLATERRRANKLAFQDQILSLEMEESQEEADQEAREECGEMMSEIRREDDREQTARLGIEYEPFFEDPWSLENIDWFGFPYGDLSGQFWDNFMGVIEWSRERNTYVDFEQATWMAAPHFGEDCFICEMMAKYGELGQCR